MCSTKPIEDAVDKAESIAEDVVHGAGDFVEDATGLDMDWDDNLGDISNYFLDTPAFQWKPSLSLNPVDYVPEPLQEEAQDVIDFGGEFVDMVGNVGEGLAHGLGELITEPFEQAVDAIGDLSLGILGPSAEVMNPGNWMETMETEDAPVKAKYPGRHFKIPDYLADPRSKKYLGHKFTAPVQTLLTGGQGIGGSPKKRG